MVNDNNFDSFVHGERFTYFPGLITYFFIIFFASITMSIICTNEVDVLPVCLHHFASSTNPRAISRYNLTASGSDS